LNTGTPRIEYDLLPTDNDRAPLRRSNAVSDINVAECVRKAECGGLVTGDINVTAGHVGIAPDNANVAAGQRVFIYVYDIVIAIIGQRAERPQQQK
jgi:hypothetical protein